MYILVVYIVSISAISTVSKVVYTALMMPGVLCSGSPLDAWNLLNTAHGV